MNDTLQTLVAAGKWTRVRVRGKPDQIDEVLNRLENLPAGWFRDQEQEDRVRKIQESASPVFVFVYQPKPDSPVVSLMLGRPEPGVLLGGQWLPLTQNYQIAESTVAQFLTAIFQPMVEQVGLTVNFTGGGPVEIYFSGNALQSLENFVRRKISSNSELRPEDRQRWNAFLIAAQRSGSGAFPEDLEKWLKGCGFSPDLAKELRNQYEFGFQLLEDYEEARNSAW